MTQRTKSKFVFSGPAKSAETLFKWVNVFEEVEVSKCIFSILLVYLFSGWYPEFWCAKQIHTTWESANSIWWFECGLLWLQSRIQRCRCCHWDDCETRDKANCWNNNLWGAISLFLHAIPTSDTCWSMSSLSYLLVLTKYIWIVSICASDECKVQSRVLIRKLCIAEMCFCLGNKGSWVGGELWSRIYV